ASPFVLVADHASRVMPAQLGSLGLPESELERHIAWDIGIAGVAHELSRRLDAFLILQGYSRLVIDANRTPRSPQSIASVSERTRVPGNEALSLDAIEAREREIFHPYHDRIRDELDRRKRERKLTALVSLHSFTPVFMDRSREWHAGVLYNRD